MISHVEKPPSTVEFIIVFYLGEYTDGFVFGTSRTVGSAKKFVRITSGFGGGEFTKTLRKVGPLCQ
jgi:hypothetical protein